MFGLYKKNKAWNDNLVVNCMYTNIYEEGLPIFQALQEKQSIE